MNPDETLETVTENMYEKYQSLWYDFQISRWISMSKILWAKFPDEAKKCAAEANKPIDKEYKEGSADRKRLEGFDRCYQNKIHRGMAQGFWSEDGMLFNTNRNTLLCYWGLFCPSKVRMNLLRTKFIGPLSEWNSIRAALCPSGIQMVSPWCQQQLTCC